MIKNLDALQAEILKDIEIPYWCECKFLDIIDELKSLRKEVNILREENLRLTKLIDIIRQHEDAQWEELKYDYPA